MTNNKKNRNNQEDFYTSLEEWEAENFPNLVKRRKRKELEKDKDIDALGIAIANDIFHQIRSELSKPS